jgi:accessory gene regulator protein AgrB
MQKSNKYIVQLIYNIFKWTYILITQALQTIVLVVIAIYHDKIFEFALLVVGYQIGRSIFGETYHAKTLLTCTIVSALVFGVTTACVPSTKISLILQIILGVAIAFVMWWIEFRRKEVEVTNNE